MAASIEWERLDAERRNRSLAVVLTLARWCEHNAENKDDPVCDLFEKMTESRDTAETAPSGASELRVTSGKKKREGKKRNQG